MTAIDTNVLIHLHWEESPKHREALALVCALAAGDATWAVPVFCLGEVRGRLDARRVLKSPTASVLGPGLRYWPLLQEVPTQSQVGSVVFDAHLVALCMKHRVDTLVSENRDFSHFDGLDVVPIRSYSHRRSMAAERQIESSDSSM